MVSPSVTQTVTWDDVYSRHAYNFVGAPGFKDNFYLGRPTLQLLRERGMSASGGKQIVHRVNFGSTAQGGSGAKGKKYDLTDVDPFTAVRYDWAYYLEPIIIYYQDEHQAGNAPDARMSLLEDKITDAGERQRDQINAHLHATSLGTSTDVLSIPLIVRADPDAADTDLIGGISAATYSAWRNQADETSRDFSAVGEKVMRDLAIDCSAGGKSVVDAWLLPSEFYSQYIDLASAKHDINTGATRAGTRIADVAFSEASFMGRPVYWDTDWDDTSTDALFALNLDGLHLVEDKAKAFKTEPFKSALVGGVDARVGWMRWVGQLTCSERRTQGRIATLT
jgi:hypothetical protein